MCFFCFFPTAFLLLFAFGLLKPNLFSAWLVLRSLGEAAGSSRGSWSGGRFADVVQKFTSNKNMFWM